MKKSILAAALLAVSSFVGAQEIQTLSGTTPLRFTSLGTGTYNKSVLYHTTNEGFWLELAKLTDSENGIPINFSINARGGTHPFLTIKGETGNMGINYLSPRAKLHIRGTSAVWSDFNNYTGISDNSFLPNGKKPTLILDEAPKGTFTPGVGGQVTYKGGMSFGYGGPGIYSINPNPAGSPYYGELRFHTTAWKDNKYYNADRMVIKLDGRIGMGTVAPSARLHVTDDGSASSTTFKLNNKFRFKGNGVLNWGNNSDNGLLSWDGIKAIVGAQSGKDLSLYANGAEKMIVKANGNVGIGISTLAAKLGIKGNSIGLEVYNTQEANLDVTQRFHIADLAFYSIGLDRSDAGKFKINYGGEIGVYNHFTMQNNGFIGLGTSAPNNNLDISNNATIRNVGVELDASHYTGNGISHAFIQFRTPNFKTDNTLTTGAAEIGLSNHNGAFYITRKTNVGVNADGIVLDKNANVGIGTTSPSEKLDVNGIIKAKSVLKIDADGGLGFVSSRVFLNSHNDYRGAGIYSIGQTNTWFTGNPYTDHANAFIIGVAPSSTNPISGVAQKKYAKFYINKNGDTGIGTTDTKGYKLAVAGSSGIIAEKVTVKLQTAWPDYVFTNNYKLPTLKEVEQHIKEKGHLKNIPSAKEVAENGVELGAMNKKLLEKVEELTLYTIQQQKQLQKQHKEIEELKKLNKELEKLKVLVHQLIKKN